MNKYNDAQLLLFTKLKGDVWISHLGASESVYMCAVYVVSVSSVRLCTAAANKLGFVNFLNLSIRAPRSTSERHFWQGKSTWKSRNRHILGGFVAYCLNQWSKVQIQEKKLWPFTAGRRQQHRLLKVTISRWQSAHVGPVCCRDDCMNTTR